MVLEILCTPEFSDDEVRDIEQIASDLRTTPEEIVRMAVRNFSAKCVPTHGGERGPHGCAA